MVFPIFTISWLWATILTIIIVKEILLYFFFNGKKIMDLEYKIKMATDLSRKEEKTSLIIERVAYYPLYFIAELCIFIASIRIVKFIYSGVLIFNISWIWTYILMYGLTNILMHKLIKVRNK